MLITISVNYETSSSKLADKMPTRIGMVTGITLDRRVNVANAANVLCDFSVILAHSLSPAMMINICALWRMCKPLVAQVTAA